MFLEIRDKTQKLLKQSGAVRLAEIISHVSGDTWTMLACIDRMIELGEIREIPQGEVSAQARIFVRARSLE